jgi:hypothetical protein
MASVTSKPSTPEYRANYDRIFNKREKKTSLTYYEFHSHCIYFKMGGTMFHCNLGVDEIDLKAGKNSEVKCCEENCCLLDKN